MALGRVKRWEMEPDVLLWPKLPAEVPFPQLLNQLHAGIGNELTGIVLSGFADEPTAPSLLSIVVNTLFASSD